MLLLKEQIALVTGAGQGNGEAIARAMANQGATVIVTDINLENAELVAESIRLKDGKASAFKLDVSDADACTELAGRVESDIGQTSVLVNNAGIYVRNSVNEPENLQSSWDLAMNINSKSVLNVTLPFIDVLKKTQGSIINIASIAAFVSTRTSIAYAASKASVVMMTKELACELAPFNVRVNSISPGSIKTAMTEQTRSDPERSNSFLQRIPMGRYGEPEEMAGPAVFLAAKSLSSYVTGANIVADGGWSSTL